VGEEDRPDRLLNEEESLTLLPSFVNEEEDRVLKLLLSCVDEEEDRLLSSPAAPACLSR
jgi:hypothetical protein